MDSIERYRDEIFLLLNTIVDTQKEAIDKAADVIVDHIAMDKLIHVIGTGAHSMMVAMELFKQIGRAHV